MKRYYKIIITAVLLMGAMMLSACANVTITCSIDNRYNVSYIVNGYIDTSKMKAQEIEGISESLNDLVAYYNENGYIASYASEGSKLHFEAEKSKQCVDYTECFAVLNDFMTSDTSPLKEYSYELNEHHFYYEYVLDGVVDTTTLVSSMGYRALPNDIRDEVDVKLTECDFRLVFNLPNQSDLIQDAGSNEIKSVPVPINQVTEFEINGKINNAENLKDSMEFVGKTKYYRNLVILFGGIILVLIIVVILAITRLKPSKKKLGKY